MRIFNLGTLNVWRQKYPDADQALRTWYRVVKKAAWKNSADVKRTYGSASIVSSSRVVFNILHNDYRLIASINYKRDGVFLRFFGTHKEYDKVDAATI